MQILALDVAKTWRLTFLFNFFSQLRKSRSFAFWSLRVGSALSNGKLVRLLLGACCRSGFLSVGWFY